CESVCPADAVVFPDSPPPPLQRVDVVAKHLADKPSGGVLDIRCYGCGRCIDVCPPGIIEARKYMRPHDAVACLLGKVEAVEIHTKKGNPERFQELWESIGAAASRLKLVAVSFPDLGEDTNLAMSTMNTVMHGNGRDIWGLRGECGSSGRSCGVKDEGGAQALNIWQTDGRPMSGDIGAGATSACIRFATKVLNSQAVPFGDGQHFVQLAGGTNNHTAPKLRELGLLPGKGGGGEGGVGGSSLKPGLIIDSALGLRGLGGVAYGGYARKVVGRVLDQLPEGSNCVEEHPKVLLEALAIARGLVEGLETAAWG
ncbi:unnamed protein product, partial [Choristocarpus tenellus]